MKSHNLPQKATIRAPWYKRIGMRMFFTRYELLEKNNFPLWTELNASCLVIIAIGCFLLQTKEMEYRALSIAMITGSLIVSMLSTYVFVAPTICRVRIIRRFYLIFVEYIMCQLMANTEFITGTNCHGYLPHLTARKIIDNDYVTEEEFEKASSLAIIRNPYARMVSIYMYNRFGPCETFSHFVKSWYNQTTKDYREHGEMDEWYTPCHAIPQFEYTHDMNGTKKLVHSVVKQEELKYLKNIEISITDRGSSAGIDEPKMLEIEGKKPENENNDEDSSDAGYTNSICSSSCSLSSSEECCTDRSMANDLSSIRCLPVTIRRALLGMPHDNRRKTKTPWYKYYDQETLNLTYEMYHRDFEIFGYDVVLKQRPDLEMPPQFTRYVTV